MEIYQRNRFPRLRFFILVGRVRVEGRLGRGGRKDKKKVFQAYFTFIQRAGIWSILVSL